MIVSYATLKPDIESCIYARPFSIRGEIRHNWNSPNGGNNAAYWGLFCSCIWRREVY